VNGNEVRDGLAKVISLAGFRLAQKSSAESGGAVYDESTAVANAARGGDQKQAGGDRAERMLDDASLMINGYAALRD